MERRVKVIVEQHEDGFVAYPVGLNGVAVARGDTYEALADVTSAIQFHIQTFGDEALADVEPLLNVVVTDAAIPA